jgi:hypothetical protein
MDSGNVESDDDIPTCDDDGFCCEVCKSQKNLRMFTMDAFMPDYNGRMIFETLFRFICVGMGSSSCWAHFCNNVVDRIRDMRIEKRKEIAKWNEREAREKLKEQEAREEAALESISTLFNNES